MKNRLKISLLITKLSISQHIYVRYDIIRNISFTLKCICNENFDFVIFALSDNFIFSDHCNTNLVENFELEVCEFCV